MIRIQATTTLTPTDLLVEDAAAELGRAMRHVLGVHTQRFNRRHGRDGPLFRGRFRSRLVQQERYLAELVRYIHMNPVDAGLAGRAGDYRWSSHPHYLRGVAPDWLVTGEVMRRFGHDPRTLDGFVHARLPPERREELRWTSSPTIVGDERFVSAWRSRLRDEIVPAPDSVAREARQWLALDCAEVLEAVCAHFDVSLEEVRTARRGHVNDARQVAVIICVDHTPHAARVVADAYAIKPRSVGALASRYRRRLETDAAFRSDAQAILDALCGGAG
ncbi:MAG: transposase [Myxococcota bacterium]